MFSSETHEVVEFELRKRAESAEQKLAELTAILGDDPVGRAKALVAEDTKVRDMLNADLVQQAREARETASRERSIYTSEFALHAKTKEEIDSLRALVAELTPLAEKQRAAEAELAQRRAEFAACTDMNASWCPVHGTCVCERGPAGDCDFDGQDCPLHASASLHAVPPMEDSEVKPSR